MDEILTMRLQDLKVPDLAIVKEVFYDDCYQAKGMIRKGDTVVDIGAHIGSFTILAGTLVGDGEVLAFEPEPDNYDLLETNARLNSYLNIKTYKRALGPRKESRTLHLSHDNAGGHSVFGSGEEIRVEAVTLEEIIGMTRNGRIDLLKLDCEGCEFDALYEIPQKVFENVSIIVMEAHLGWMPFIRFEPLRKFLDLVGYTPEFITANMWEDEGVTWLVKAERKTED